MKKLLSMTVIAGSLVALGTTVVGCNNTDSTLENKVNDIEAELIQIQKEKADLEREMAELKEEQLKKDADIKELEELNKALGANMADLNEKATTLNTFVGDYAAKVTMLKSKLAIATEKEADLVAQIATLASDLDGANATITSLNGQKATLEVNLADALRQKDALIDALATSEKSNVEMVEAIERATALVSDLFDRIDRLNTEIAAQVVSSDQLKASLKDANDAIWNLNATKEALEKDIMNKDARIVRLTELYTEVAAKLAGQELSNQELVKINGELNQALDMFANEIKEMKEEIAAAALKEAAMDKQIKDLEIQLQVAQQLNAKLEEQKDAIQDDYEFQLGRANDLEKANTELEGLKATLETEKANLQKDIAAKNTKIANLESDLSFTRDMLFVSQTEVVALKNTKAQLEKRIEELLNSKDDNKEQIKELEKQIEEATKMLDKLNEENIKLIEKLTEAQAKIKELENKLRPECNNPWWKPSGC